MDQSALSKQANLTCHFLCSSCADCCEIAWGMRLVWKSLDKMRCLRKRSTIPFLGFLITFLLFLNLYIEDGYMLVGTFVCIFLAFAKFRWDTHQVFAFLLNAWTTNVFESEHVLISLHPSFCVFNCLFFKDLSLNIHNMQVELHMIYFLFTMLPNVVDHCTLSVCYLNY